MEEEVSVREIKSGMRGVEVEVEETQEVSE